jgi:hypothetical protein
MENFAAGFSGMMMGGGSALPNMGYGSGGYGHGGYGGGGYGGSARNARTAGVQPAGRQIRLRRRRGRQLRRTGHIRRRVRKSEQILTREGGIIFQLEG